MFKKYQLFNFPAILGQKQYFIFSPILGKAIFNYPAFFGGAFNSLTFLKKGMVKGRFHLFHIKGGGGGHLIFPILGEGKA